MRLTGKLKAGYYPLPLQALSQLHNRLRLGAGAEGVEPHYAVLDPCAGEGAALHGLMKMLKLPTSMAHAIELDPTRGEAIRQAMPDAEVVAPCSMFGADIPSEAYSLLYLNPPFDESTKGVRVECQFLRRAFHCLVPGGVLVMVCPEKVTTTDDFRDIIGKCFERVDIVRFSDEYRKFQEVFVLGVRRKRDLPSRMSFHNSTQVSPNQRWFIPPAKPRWPIEKTTPTDDELITLLRDSPLNKLLEPKKIRKMASPPLALGTGHLALLLSAGHLDGLVCPDGEPPHVVRGTAVKTEVVTEDEQTIEKGKIITKTTHSEQIKLTIRVARHNGDILTIQ